MMRMLLLLLLFVVLECSSSSISSGLLHRNGFHSVRHRAMGHHGSPSHSLSRSESRNAVGLGSSVSSRLQQYNRTLTHLEIVSMLSARMTFSPLAGVNCSDLSQETPSERAALYLFYNSMNGPNWILDQNWMREDYFICCSWQGVICNIGPDGRWHVIILWEQRNNLLGTIPPQVLQNLPFLYVFSIPTNLVSGSIPPLNLPYLAELALDHNLISGTLPVVYLPSLTNFFVTSNRIVGEFHKFDLSSASKSLLQLELYNNRISGELQLWRYRNYTSLQTLELMHNSISGTIDDLSEFPHLSSLKLHFNRISGTISHLRNMTALTDFRLAHNYISSSLPSDIFASAPLLEAVLFGSNLLSGELPSNYSSTRLAMLDFSHNQFDSTIPPCFWQFPTMRVVSLQDNRLTGSLDANTFDTYIPRLYTVLLDSNRLSGVFPSLANLPNLESLDLSSNFLSSTLPPLNFSTLKALLVSSNRLSGQIELISMESLQHLELANNQFSGPLDFISSLQNLSIFDGSSNNWTNPELPANVSALLNVFVCSSCNLQCVIPQSWSTLSRLATLTLQNNSIITPLPNIYALQSLDLSYNQLSGTIADVFFRVNDPTGYSQWFLVVIDLSHNNISNSLPDDMFYPGLGDRLFKFVLDLDLSHNSNLGGTLPSVGSFFTGGEMDSAYTLPSDGDSIPAFGEMGSAIIPQLTHFDLSYTAISGDIPDSFGQLTSLQELQLQSTRISRSSGNSLLPSFIAPQLGSSVEQFGAYSCPSLSLQISKPGSVSVDPSYYHFALCSCNPGYFGVGANCTSCTSNTSVESCTCSGNVVQECFPTPEGILPCLSSVLGNNPCNPDAVPWPADDTGMSPLDYTINPSILSLFCATGYTGRLCSKCSDGYFSASNSCLRCFSVPVHIILFIVYLALFGLLCVYLYVKTPSLESLDAFSSLLDQDSLPFSTPSDVSLSPRSSPIVLRQKLPTRSIFHAKHSSDMLSESSSQLCVFHSVDDLISYARKRVRSSSLRILIFHLQQMSILLSMNITFPIFGSVMSVSSSTSSLSFRSVIALECIDPSWSISSQLYLALLLPVSMFLVFLGLALYHSHKRAKQVLLRLEATGLGALLLLFFPCAQAGLSAISCVDVRQSSQTFLNAYPWQACDQSWQDNILPPAVVAVTLWMVVFPLGLVILLLYLRGDRDSYSIITLTSYVSGSFKPKFWWWESVLMTRRMALVLCVSFIPIYNVYLPVVLVAIFQVAVFLQHQVHPFAKSLDNWFEIISLHLLTINFLTGYIFRTSDYSPGSGSAWLYLLLILNVLFVLIIVVRVLVYLVIEIKHVISGARRVRAHKPINQNQEQNQEPQTLGAPLLSRLSL